MNTYRPIVPQAALHCPSRPAPAGDTDAASVASNLDDDCCDLCCAVPVVAKLDGDRMCQRHADEWVRGQRQDEVLSVNHPAMRKAMDDWRAKYRGDLTDAEIKVVQHGHKAFVGGR